VRAFAGTKHPRVLLVRPDRYVLGAFYPRDAAAFMDRLNDLIGSQPAPTHHAHPDASEAV
jgi:3-(3-hydroxy-phenyl)propionate hydroxylase